MMPPADDRNANGLGRRRVLQLLMGGSSLAVAGLAAASVVDLLRPLEPAEEDAIAALPGDAMAPWDARQVVVSGRPVWVVRTDAGFRAFSAVCTHLGCVVKWKKGRREFFCPCHGARFGVDGEVRGGPAPRPLEPLEVSEGPEEVVVRKARS